MSKPPYRSKRKPSNSKRQASKSNKQRQQQAKQRPVSKPWLSETTGYRTVAVVSLLLAVFIAWQVWPAEGAVRAILWGLGFGAAIWGVFLLTLAFNNWVRSRRNG